MFLTKVTTFREEHLKKLIWLDVCSRFQGDIRFFLTKLYIFLSSILSST